MNILSNLLVIFCVFSVIIGCSVLLYYCLQNRTGIEEGEELHHEYDGIRETNNPLPTWWTYLFIILIIFAVIYLILYPGLGNYKGILNWHSSAQGVKNKNEEKEIARNIYSQYDKEIQKSNKKFSHIFKALSEKSVEELMQEPSALNIGKRLFLQNCAQCHNYDAKGGKGFPDLTDDDWLYGGSFDTIKATLTNGRRGFMPPKGGLPITDEEIPNLVEYVLSLSDSEHDTEKAKLGQASFLKGCFACHGLKGEGNQLLGAPNLSDKIWLYGGTREDIAYSIKNGRSGVMPAWKDILGPDKIHVVAAYIYSLSHQDQVTKKNQSNTKGEHQ